MPKKDCERCGSECYFASYCGAWLCPDCEHHQGLVRCYCGWTASGSGDGRRQLIEMGETIDPDDY